MSLAKNFKVFLEPTIIATNFSHRATIFSTNLATNSGERFLIEIMISLLECSFSGKVRGPNFVILQVNIVIYF